MMLKTLAYIICYIIYPFSFLFPRKKSRCAFGSFRGAFNDNAKYLFIYANEHCPDKELAWISSSAETVAKVRSLGYRAYRSTSLKGAFYALTSKWWFFNAYTSDIMFCLSGGAQCVNLWHGVGLKRIEFNTVSGPLAERFIKRRFREVFYHPESFRRPDWLLSSSPFQTAMFAKAFRIPQSRCLEFGYPRNAVLKSPEEALKGQFSGYRKVYIYMPTWRDSQRDIFVQNMDLKTLNGALAATESLLLLKPHANTIVNADLDGLSNIRFIDPKEDVYPLLPFTDVLITDYSSILYDYVLMPGKSVVLYLYDYAQYVKERDFYYPFDENVAGQRAENFQQLLDIIKQGPAPLDESQRRALVEKFWGESQEKDSSRELMDFISNN